MISRDRLQFVNQLQRLTTVKPETVLYVRVDNTNNAERALNAEINNWRRRM